MSIKNLIIRDPKQYGRVIYYIEGGAKDIEKYRHFERVEGYELETTDKKFTFKWDKWWETGDEEGDYE